MDEDRLDPAASATHTTLWFASNEFRSVSASAASTEGACAVPMIAASADPAGSRGPITIRCHHKPARTLVSPTELAFDLTAALTAHTHRRLPR